MREGSFGMSVRKRRSNVGRHTQTIGRSAFIVGGTGQIGRASARRLLDGGWEVTLGARTPVDVPGTRFVELDRRRGIDPPGDFDALIDCRAFTADDAGQLLELAGRVGTLVAISSASVYASDLASAELPVPIPESQPTVEPGTDDYSAGKRAMELVLLGQDAVPATVLRPCAIHGPHAKGHVREWYFVKRALDRRPHVLLAYHGESRFHTTSVANLAELVGLACERPGTRALNAGDPDPPTTSNISHLIAAITGHERVELLLEDAPDAAGNPWAVARPFVVDMSAAERELGYRPVTTYPEAVEETVAWLLAEQPPLGEYMATFFDYDAEDEYVRGLAG
jgi:nucleoside-diphosphate-sugar epimerase